MHAYRRSAGGARAVRTYWTNSTGAQLTEEKNITSIIYVCVSLLVDADVNNWREYLKKKFYVYVFDVKEKKVAYIYVNCLRLRVPSSPLSTEKIKKLPNYFFLFTSST